MKWPNDVLIFDAVGAARPGKVAGLLAEVTTGGAVVIGIGLNVTTRLAELPDERATSLALAGARTTDRETILKAILRSLARAYASWRADPAALMPAYRAACVSIGRQVRVELPGASPMRGSRPMSTATAASSWVTGRSPPEMWSTCDESHCCF